MANLVDYEAVQEGDDFTFIKAIREDGTIDPRFGQNGPYSICSIAYGDEIRISYPEDLTQEQTSEMLKQFRKKYFYATLGWFFIARSKWNSDKSLRTIATSHQ
jgi:hypothetical protein